MNDIAADLGGRGGGEVKGESDVTEPDSERLSFSITVVEYEGMVLRGIGTGAPDIEATKINVKN